MSPRRLTGWEPTRHTTYRYDEQGRLTDAITTTEPEWAPSDLDEVQAQWVWEESLDGNGIPWDEATDPQAGERRGKFHFRAGLPTVNPETGQVVYAPVVNYAEKAKRDAMDALRKADPEANLNGLFFPVAKVSR